MSRGFGGHTPYEILRDLGGLIGSVIALIAAGVAYYAGRMQVTATARATSDQIAAQRTREEKEAANVREAVQTEITGRAGELESRAVWAVSFPAPIGFREAGTAGVPVEQRWLFLPL